MSSQNFRKNNCFAIILLMHTVHSISLLLIGLSFVTKEKRKELRKRSNNLLIVLILTNLIWEAKKKKRKKSYHLYANTTYAASAWWACELSPNGIFFNLICWEILKNATFGQLILKNASYKKSLCFMSLFNCEFDRIAPSVFTI